MYENLGLINTVSFVFVPQLVFLLSDNWHHLGPEPVFTKRGVVMVRSLKSGLAEFVEHYPLNPQQKNQLKVFTDVSFVSLNCHLLWQ